MAFTFVRLQRGHFHFCVLHVQGQRLCSKEPEHRVVRQTLLGGPQTTLETSTQMIKVFRILRGKPAQVNSILSGREAPVGEGSDGPVLPAVWKDLPAWVPLVSAVGRFVNAQRYRKQAVPAIAVNSRTGVPDPWAVDRYRSVAYWELGRIAGGEWWASKASSVSTASR